MLQNNRKELPHKTSFDIVDETSMKTEPFFSLYSKKKQRKLLTSYYWSYVFQERGIQHKKLLTVSLISCYDPSETK